MYVWVDDKDKAVCVRVCVNTTQNAIYVRCQYLHLGKFESISFDT